MSADAANVGSRTPSLAPDGLPHSPRLNCNVRFWHKADMLNALTNVRFWGQSGDCCLPISIYEYTA
jgi:hypothetical protein